MRSDNWKVKSRGFGLVEILLAVVIIGILSGMTLVAVGRSSDNAEATAIMAHLESAKSALLAYSMENSRRNVDPIAVFPAVNANGIIHASLDKYLDSNVQTGGGSKAVEYFDRLRVRRDGAAILVGFQNIRVTSGVKSALDKRIDASGGTYTRSGSAAEYTMWMRVR